MMKEKRVTQGRKRKLIEGVAKGLAQGKTQAQAAIDAGASPGAAKNVGSQIAKLPETKALIEKYREKYNCGIDRVFKEIDRGLGEATPDGKHGDYVDRITKLNGLIQDQKGDHANSGQVIVNLFQAIESARNAGIIDVPPETAA